MSENKCFLISPIGEAGTAIREYADKVCSFLQNEVFAENDLDYHVVRSDRHMNAGGITETMINDIIDSELVIAFLDGDNPNVYYEIAVRHAAAKSCLAIVSTEYRRDHSSPFDLSDVRQIFFPCDLMNRYDIGQNLSAGLIRFKQDLVRSIRSCEENGDEVVHNPITRARQDFIIPPRMTTEDLIQQVLEAWRVDANKELVSAIVDQVKEIPPDIAEYIDGEDLAFLRLAEMTLKAQSTLRTSRFAPQAISGTNNDYKTKFFNALCAFGKRTDVVCTRIMCMNEKQKFDDLWGTINATATGSMELYLTKRSNNFELVVIDEKYAFLHFYDDNKSRKIKSTLFIKDPRVAREFERIYCSILEDGEYEFHVIRCADCKEPSQQAAAFEEAKREFKRRKID